MVRSDLVVSAPITYSQETLFQQVVAPAFKAYPEISWFADDKVAVTNEVSSKEGSEKSWTAFLVNEKLLPDKHQNKKYIELERMLHSLVALHLLREGSDAAYAYWIQKQDTAVALTREDFRSLHELVKQCAGTSDSYQAIEASLVYSDLGKTPQAKTRALKEGINQKDHDDFMDAIYSAPNETREKIIPSFAQLKDSIQIQILALHRAIPLHWGHAQHIEGGEGMLSRLMTSKGKVSVDQVKQAFLIQVCDVAGARAQFEPRGMVACDHFTYQGYQTVLEVVQTLLRDDDSNPKSALLDLIHRRAEQLGFPSKELSERDQILVRMGAFLRLYTKEQGALLRKAAGIVLTKPEDWTLMVEMFGLESGINAWERNPTYMPAVLLNSFNSTKDPSEQYKRALQGALVLAKIAKEYQEHGYHQSKTPLCFNPLAGQASKSPAWFEKFTVSQIDWQKPQDIVITEPTSLAPTRVPRPASGKKVTPQKSQAMRYVNGAVVATVATTGLFILYKLFIAQSKTPGPSLIEGPGLFPIPKNKL